MRITHGQAIEAVEIILAMAKESKDQRANALLLAPDLVKQINELVKRIEENDGGDKT